MRGRKANERETCGKRRFPLEQVGQNSTGRRKKEKEREKKKEKKGENEIR